MTMLQIWGTQEWNLSEIHGPKRENVTEQNGIWLPDIKKTKAGNYGLHMGRPFVGWSCHLGHLPKISQLWQLSYFLYTQKLLRNSLVFQCHVFSWITIQLLSTISVDVISLNLDAQKALLPTVNCCGYILVSELIVQVYCRLVSMNILPKITKVGQRECYTPCIVA